MNAINLSLADLKRRHESASAPYVQARQDVGLEDDRDAPVVRGRRKGPNAVMRVAPERDELILRRCDRCIEGGGLAVFDLVQRARSQAVLVEPRIRDFLDLEDLVGVRGVSQGPNAARPGYRGVSTGSRTY